MQVVSELTPSGKGLPGLEEGARIAAKLRESLGQRFLGQPEVADLMVAALLAGGHVLVEGAPGLGKTRLARSMAGLLDLRYGRVQCTPDLMPGDITGGVVLETASGGVPFRFVEGPVFCNVFLADEVNRATPRTQSALLEAMEEGQVTVGGRAHELPRPFFVVATQNPIELEGTYPLPEAQLDRFMFKLEVDSPDRETLEQILELPPTGMEEPLSPLLDREDVLHLQRLAGKVALPEGFLRRTAEIVRATDPRNPEATDGVREQVLWGASPRAGRAALAGARGLALLRNRAHVAPEDLRDALLPALRHRVLLRYEARAAGGRSDDLVAEILDRFPVR